MKKRYKYTLLTLLLAFVFAFGSMEGMNLILRARERQFLTESGSVVVEAPVRAWQERENGKEAGNSENSEKEEYVLTAWQMEEVISSWDERMAVIHAPVDGQISMEDAMKAGEEWLVEMGMIENVEDQDHSMYARLSAAVQKELEQTQLEPYYSFWFVRYSSQSMMAFLYINAVTGKVWNADINFYEELPEEMPYERLKYFVELAGLQASEIGIIKNQEETQAILPVNDSVLCAEMEFHHSQAGYPYTVHDEMGLIEYNNTIDRDRENVEITFKLTVKKEFE